MPFQSEAQRRLMYAAAAGKDTKADISQKEAKKMVSHDEPGKLPEKVEKAGEGDGSDMAKQFLAEINEMSEKIDSMINGKQELEDWVDGKITRAKTDLSDISGYLEHNKNILAKAKECCEMLSKKKQKAAKSIHGSENTPNRVANTVDGIAKADDEMGDYEKKAKGALDFRNQMKDFRRQHGSTIMDIAAGRRVPADRADAYHAARGQLTVGHGVGLQDIPPKIPGHLIDRPKVQAEEVKPPALPAAKSMEALANPKSLLAKVEDCIKCMKSSSGEKLEKSSKKPFHGYNKKKHARSGGLNDSYRKKLNRETGSNLKRPVTKKNVKPGSKAAKRRKSFCARMRGVKGPTSKKGKLTPKGAALKRWRCSKSLNKSESVPLELRAQRVLKSLGMLIKGDVIDFTARKKQPTQSSSSGKMSFAEIADKNRANQQRLAQERSSANEQTKAKYGIKPLESKPAQPDLQQDAKKEAYKQALAGMADHVNATTRKPPAFGNDVFTKFPREKIENMINEWGIDGLGLTEHYGDAANRLHQSNLEDEGLEYNDDTDQWLDSNGESVDPEDYFPQDHEILDEMLESGSDLYDWDAHEENANKSFDKSNNLKPFGTNVYDNTANLGRKVGRVGQEAEGLGPNTAVQQRGNALHGTIKDQTEHESKRLTELNRKQPVKSVDFSLIPADKKQEVAEALLNGKFHPLIERATRVLLTNKRKKSGADVVEPTDKSLEKKLSLKGLLAAGAMGASTLAGAQPPAKPEPTPTLSSSVIPPTHVIGGYNKEIDADKEVDKSLEKKLSLKGMLTAGALGASALAGGAQASPESDLHSQLSNLNVMGEYHTPKTGSKAVLKEPSQLKADPSHPTASYSRESTGSSSMGNFYGPDAAKAKALLQNYDATTKSFKKSNKLKGGKGDKSRKSDFSAKQLADGMKVESEHTKDSKAAEEIVLDHLTEDPRYYSKLKTSGLADELEKRCWEGYEPVPGKKPYSKGSCVKKAISAPAIESGEYKGEKLDAHHHNRLGKEYREMARQAIAKGDKEAAVKHHAKSLFHFSRAEEMGYRQPEE